MTSFAQDGELTSKNCSVAIVGKDTAFKILSVEELQKYIGQLDSVDAPAEGMDSGDTPADEADAPKTEGGDAADPMETT